MKGEVLEALLAARADRRPVVRATWLEDGREALFGPGEPGLPVGLDEAVDGVLRRDEATLVETADGSVFVQPFNPPLRLAIVGAVHIAQHLAQLATGLAYDVTVIDPRRGFLTEARFPGVEPGAAPLGQRGGFGLLDEAQECLRHAS